MQIVLGDKMSIDFYNEDCFGLIPKLHGFDIELILTDPPYNIANKTKLTVVGNKGMSTQQAWGNQFNDSWDNIDQYKTWLIDFVIQAIPCMSQTGSLIMFLDRNYTGLFIYEIEKLGLIFRNKIYFEKLNPLPHFRKNNYRSTMEEAIWFTKGDKYTFNFGEQSDMKQVFRGNIGKKETKHPTEKYLWMIKPLIERHSNINDLIFDPFAGSASVGVACRELQRNFIGCELNNNFWEQGNQRLNNLQSQLFE
jgi:DNA modification methylase